MAQASSVAMLGSRTGLALVTVAVLLAGSPAVGQPAGASSTAPAPKSTCHESPRACGRRAFKEGLEAFDEKDYGAALAAFEESHRYKAHPVVLLNIAVTKSKLRRYRAALKDLKAVQNDPKLPASKKESLRLAQEEAEAGLALVTIDAPRAELVVDGEVATGDPPRVKVDPGQHAVLVRRAGQLVLERTVRVREGETLRLSLASIRAGDDGGAGAPSGGPAAEPVVPPSSGLSPVWVYAGAGVTAVLGGVAIWSALDADSAFSDLEAEAPALDPATAQDRADDGKGRDLRTNLLLAGTAVAGLATVSLAVFFVDWSRGLGWAAPATERPLAPGGMTFRVGAGRFDVIGRF